jgi:hypothetical protein
MEKFNAFKTKAGEFASNQKGKIEGTKNKGTPFRMKLT